MPDHILVDDIIDEMIDNLDYIRLSSCISIIKKLEKKQ